MPVSDVIPTTKRGELKERELHPATKEAITYIVGRIDNPILLESLASCAIENNRLAEICLETIRRIKNKEAVGERYILGLAWTLKNFKHMKEHKDEH